MLWNSGKLISKKSSMGTALLVQWLRLHLPVQREQFQSLVRELRSHMPCGQKPRTKNRSNIVTNPVNALKIVLIRNNLGGGGEVQSYHLYQNNDGYDKGDIY